MYEKGLGKAVAKVGDLHLRLPFSQSPGDFTGKVARKRWKALVCGTPFKQLNWIVAFGTTRQTALVGQI